MVFTEVRIGGEPFVTGDLEKVEELRRLKVPDPETLLQQVRRFGAIELPRDRFPV
jgi:hypothetical protein